MVKFGSLVLPLLVSLTSAPAQDSPPELPSGFRFAADVPYVEDGHERQKLDIAYPEKGKARALLVWIHGGAYAFGDKKEFAPLYREMLEEGYAVATINYRLSGDAKWPAQITDCKAALRFLKAKANDYHIAPDRIAVWGSSAGGHLAALVTVSGGAKKFDVGGHLDQTSTVRCGVDMFGPIDFEKMPLRDDPNSPEARMWGRSTADALELAREASPITYLSPETPPVLVFHGEADTVVSIDQSRLFHQAMKKAKARGDFVDLPGVGHSHEEVWGREKKRILAFFRKNL